MLTAFFTSLLFALEITAPIFLLVLLGVVLRRLSLLDQQFLNTASKLVFTVGLPTLLFINIVETNIQSLFDTPLVLVGIIATAVSYSLIALFTPLFVKDKREQGVVIQGAFRGNLGIVGLAFCISAYGDAGIGPTAIFMAAVTVLYNILAVYILTKTLSDQQTTNLSRTIIISILKNPLVVAIAAALLLATFKIQLPSILTKTGNYISAMTLPLALICIGGSISLKELQRTSSVSTVTVVIKLIAVPAIAVLTAISFNLPKMEMGIVFLMTATPTATASYIMVQAMKGNGVLAANIVVISTLLSIVTVSFGLVLLRSLHLL